MPFVNVTTGETGDYWGNHRINGAPVLLHPTSISFYPFCPFIPPTHAPTHRRPPQDGEAVEECQQGHPHTVRPTAVTPSQQRPGGGKVPCEYG